MMNRMTVMLNKIGFWGVLSLLVLSFGCKVGKDYQRPDLDTPEYYRGADTTQLDTSNLSQVAWQNFFEDPVLKALIDSAIANNYDMQDALKTIQIADQRLRESKAGYLPSIDGIARSTQEWRSDNAYTSPMSKYYEEGEAPGTLFRQQSQWEIGLSLNWELDIWGKIRRQNEASLANYLQTYEARKLLQTELISEVAKGYYNLLTLDAQIEVAKRNLALNDSTLKMVKLQWDAGLITSLAIQQTEAQRLVAAALIPELEQAISVQENALMALTGQMPGRIKRSKTSALSTNQFQDSLSAGVPLDLLRFRPDVRAAELDLRAANANVGVAQAYRYPALTLEATGGLNSMLTENWFNIPGALFGDFLGGLTQPIFKNRKLKTEYEVAKLERDKTEIAFQKSVLGAVNDVTNALKAIQMLNKRHDIGEQKVANSRLAVKNAALLFRSGLATYLEVITAQSNALESELDLVVLKQLRQNARIDLYRSLGGGWK